MAGPAGLDPLCGFAQQLLATTVGLQQGSVSQLQKRDPQEADDLEALPVAFVSKGH